LGHRGLTHSLLAVVGGLMLIQAMEPKTLLGRLVEPMALGYLSHLAADALTPAGVPLLWPLKQRFALPVCSTGGLMEMAVVAAILGAAAWLVLR
jgi:inner membrane protein